MKDRQSDDFSDIIAELRFSNTDIVPVPKKFDNSKGVYFNEKTKIGFQYAAAFATVDKFGATWIEIFGIEKDGTKMAVRGRALSKHMGKDPTRKEVENMAAKLIEEEWLTPE